MAALGLLVVGGGLILVYAGFRGVSIIDTFRAALDGQPLPQGGAPSTGVPGTPPGSLNLPPTDTPNPNPGIGSNTPIATAPSGQPIYGYIQP